MTFKKLHIFIITLFISVNSLANENITVKGFGSNYPIAIQNALVEAVKQKYGVQISINEANSLMSMHSNNKKQANIQKQTSKDISIKGSGYISNYKIISQNYNETSNEYEVELNIEFSQYNIPSEDVSRRRIFISNFNNCNKNTSCTNNDAQTLKTHLINNYTATRKFAVLDRDNSNIYQNETDLILSNQVSYKDKARLNMVWATDYILTGSIKQLSTNTTKDYIKLTKETIYTKTATALIDYQISLYASRQIKYSSQLKISLSPNETKNLSNDEMKNLLMKKASLQIVEKTLEAIYPPIVIQKTKNGVILNISEATTKLGTQYDIFNTSNENLIDPYTKESLGPIENYIATIKISDIKPKYSIGTITKGNLSDIQIGAICRKKQGDK